MAAVSEDEESLLSSSRGSRGLSRGNGKTARWQGRYRSLSQLCRVRSRVTITLTLAVLALVFITLWMLYV